MKGLSQQICGFNQIYRSISGLLSAWTLKKLVTFLTIAFGKASLSLELQKAIISDHQWLSVTIFFSTWYVVGSCTLNT